MDDSFERLENAYDAAYQDKIRFSRFEQSHLKKRNSKSPRIKKLIASTDMHKMPKKSLREEFKAADITHAASFSKDGNESPFRGPGDYILPDLVGKKKAEGRQQNEPIYSFGLKLNTKAVPSSKHVQDYLLTESPGVGTYKPEAVNPKKQTPSFSWGNQKRFRSLDYNIRMKSTIPHMYAQTQDFLRKKGGASFGTARRGSPHRQDTQFTPAPGAYNTVYHNSVVNNYQELSRPRIISPKHEIRHASVDRSLHSQKLKNALEAKLNSNSTSVLSIDSKDTGYLSSSLKGPTFGLNHNKKVFAREFGSDFLTRQSPGPLAYDVISTKSRFTKGVGTDASKFSFGKSDRGLKFEKNNEAPSPTSYKAEVDQVKKGSPRAIMSQAERTIDVRKYASLNSYIWSKGMAV